MPVDEQPTNQPATPLAEATKTETVDTPEITFSKTRFDEINKRVKEAEKRVAELQKAKDDAEKATLMEQAQFKKLYEGEQTKAQKLATDLEQLQAKLKRAAIVQAVEREATTAKFADPADAHAFINLDAIELDEAGKPQGVNKLITDLAKSKPYLLTQTQAAPGNGRLPKPAGVVGVTPDQIAEKKRQSGDYVAF